MKNLKLLLLAIWMLATTFAFSQENQAEGSNQISFISEIGCEVEFDMNYILKILVNGEEISDSLISKEIDTTLVSFEERWFISDGVDIVTFAIDSSYSIKGLVIRDKSLWYYAIEDEDNYYYLDPFISFRGDDGLTYRYFVFEFSFANRENQLYFQDDNLIIIGNTSDGRCLYLFQDVDGFWWGRLKYSPENDIFILEDDPQNQILLDLLFEDPN